MGDVTKLGTLTKVLAADIADKDHPINQSAGSQYNGQAGVAKVVGRMYLRDNGTNDFDIAIPIEEGSTGKWVIIGTGGAVITPA